MMSTTVFETRRGI